MDTLLADIGPTLLLSCALAAFFAGLVKGVVGFAMPMIMISLLSSLISPDLALAALIFPTLLTNSIQALRHGFRAALSSVMNFKVFLLVGGTALLLSAQLVRVLPATWLLLAIGLFVALFAALQLGGWAPKLKNGKTARLDAAVGGVAGFIGGMSGIWGPPTVAYLTALNTEKREHLRVQGVVYGLGAVALTFAHIGSGILNAESGKFSLMMVPTAMVGMWLGGRIQDRIDQATFRKATLVVLLVAGANLIRRAVMGG